MDMLFRKRLMPIGIPQIKMYGKGATRVMRPLPIKPMIGAGGAGIRKMY